MAYLQPLHFTAICTAIMQYAIFHCKISTLASWQQHAPSVSNRFERNAGGYVLVYWISMSTLEIPFKCQMLLHGAYQYQLSASGPVSPLFLAEAFSVSST